MAETTTEVQGYPRLYSRIPMVIVRDYGKELGSTAIHVLLALSTYEDPATGEATVSCADLAEMVGCCTLTVRRSLRKLGDAGLLYTQPRSRDDGSSLANMYQIIVPRRSHG